MSEDYAEWTSKHYESTVGDIAQSLRDLADRIERAAVPFEGASVDGSPRYASAARQVLHELMWGLANVKVDRIVGVASAADDAERATP